MKEPNLLFLPCLHLQRMDEGVGRGEQSGIVRCGRHDHPGIAEGIFNAFSTFKKRYDRGGAPAASEKKEDKPAPKDTAAEKPAPKDEKASEKPSGPVYGTQVLAIGKMMDEKDPFFKGEKFFVVEGARINRYLVGFSTDREEAKKEFQRLKKIFPDSFFVKAENGKTVLDR